MAKYQAPEGYVLDPGTGLYYTQVIAEDGNGNKSQVVTWFNADTGEYRQDVYPIKGGANTAPPLSNAKKEPKGPSKAEQKKQAKQAKLNSIPKPPKVDASDDYQYHKNQNFMRGLGVVIIFCIIMVILIGFFIKFLMGESSCTMSKEDYNELQQAKKEAVADAFSSSNDDNSANRISSDDSDGIDYSSYHYYPPEEFSHVFIRLYKNSVTDEIEKIDIDSIGDVLQSFPNIPAKDSSQEFNYKWALEASEAGFVAFITNTYNDTNANSTVKIPDMDRIYHFRDEDGSFSTEVGAGEIWLKDFSIPLHSYDGFDRDTDFKLWIYVPYWDEPICIEDLYVDVQGESYSTRSSSSGTKQKPADLFLGVDTSGSESASDSAVMAESAGEKPFYIAKFATTDPNLQGSSATTIQFYENGTFNLHVNFLEGFCDYNGNYSVQDNGYGVDISLYGYDPKNGVPSTATVSIDYQRVEYLYFLDEGFGMMGYDYGAPYEFKKVN